MIQDSIQTKEIGRDIVPLARTDFHKESVVVSQLLRCRLRCTFLLNDWSDLDDETVGKSFRVDCSTRL